MAGLTSSMGAMVEALKKLPGVGARTAERFTFFILTQPAAYAQELTQAILKVKQTIRFCRDCFNLSDEELCAICADSGRDHSVICVVEHPRGIMALEKMGQYKGVYHVLLGALSPLDGIGPRDIKIQELRDRIKAGSVREIILATDSDLEGESTALYLTKELKALEVPSMRVTRLASGIPMGSAVEYADQVTLVRALEGRREL